MRFGKKSAPAKITREELNPVGKSKKLENDNHGVVVIVVFVVESVLACEKDRRTG